MSSRLATDAEVARWREEGWVLLDGLIGTEEIDAAADDLGNELLLVETARRYPKLDLTPWREGLPSTAASTEMATEVPPGHRAEVEA